MTSIFAFDLGIPNVKVEQCVKYLGQRSFRSKVMVLTDRHTYTGPIALRGPLKWSVINIHNKYVSLRGPTFIHTCRSHVHTPRDIDYGSSSHPELCFRVGGRFIRFWASGEQSSLKIREYLPRTPMNHRAKFDAVSSILAGQIRNRTNKHTNTQTTTDISTLCLSACADKKSVRLSAACLTSERSSLLRLMVVSRSV